MLIIGAFFSLLIAGVVIESTNNSGSRKWDKKNYCYFCEKPQSKIWRHIRDQHGDEHEVAEILAQPSHSQHLISRLRNQGNHKHNIEVLKSGQGKLIVAYRQSHEAEPKDYSPCPTCYAYLVTKEMWRHRCSLGKKDKSRKRVRVAQTSKMMLPSEKSINPVLQNLLASSRSDSIGMIMKNDPLILEFGRKRIQGRTREKESEDPIRSSMRRLARLLSIMRERSSMPDATLASFIDPSKFRSVLEAARELAGYDEEKGKFATPSLALKIGAAMKQCATILQSQNLESANSEKAQKCVDFRSIVEMNWTDEVSRAALRNLRNAKLNKPRLLPLTEDIMKMSRGTKEEARIVYKRIIDASPDEDISAEWKMLSELSLVIIILFNRRRPGEVSKMKIEDFKVRTSNGQKFISESLTKSEQELCRVFHRVEIIGKCGNFVPILLSDEILSWVRTIIQHRSHAGVNDGNPFLFAYGATSHLYGTALMRKYSTKYGAEQPELLRCTNLRKHIATVSQIANLKNNELDVLAKFMGHDINIHRQYYRLPEETLQVARISKLFLAIDNGSTICGKTLASITVDQEGILIEITVFVILILIVQKSLKMQLLTAMMMMKRHVVSVKFVVIFGEID